MKTTPMIGAALALSALLASCGGGSGSTPDPAPYTVSGTLTTPNENATSEATFFGPWAGGAGTIQAKAGSTGAALASGAVAADGNFSVSLPGTIASGNLEAVSAGDFDLSDENCTGSGNVSGQGALGTPVAFSVDSASSDGLAGPIALQEVSSGTDPTTVVVTAGVLMYVDRATTISGQQTCRVQGITVSSSVNAALKAGYNRINVVLTLSASGGELNASVGTWPSRWIVGSASALPLSLNKSNTARRLLERQAERLLPWQ